MVPLSEAQNSIDLKGVPTECVLFNMTEYHPW